MIKFSVFIFFFYSVAAVPSNLNPNISGRIVGGVNARAGQFPFLAAIYITRADGNYFCSGALIDNDYVLTAGQCVDGAVLFTILLGSTSLQGDENTLRLVTENYFLHPDYNPATLENDVGLIKFRSYITFNDYIKPARYLATSELPDSATVVTAGWGQISDSSGGPIDSLNYVYLTTISNEECRITYGSQITDSMVCVAGSYNQGTCLGDSGSPLVQYTASENVYHVGISSFYSGNGCETPDPSGFTRTSHYEEWIMSVIRS